MPIQKKAHEACTQQEAGNGRSHVKWNEICPTILETSTHQSVNQKRDAQKKDKYSFPLGMNIGTVAKLFSYEKCNSERCGK